MVSSKPNSVFPKLLLAMATAFVVRILPLFMLDPAKFSFGDQRVYLEVAVKLFKSGFLYEGNPTAMFPPVYPIFIALVSVLSRDPMAVRLAQIIIASLLVFPIYKLSLRFSSRKGAMLAVFFYALYIPAASMPVFIYPQMLASVWAIGFLAFNLSLSGRPFRWFRDLLYGAYIAIGGLLVTMMLPLAFLPTIFLLKKDLRRWFLVAAGFLVILSPWAVRNYAVFNKPVLFSSTGGKNLWAGNCQWATSNSGSNPIYRTEEGVEILSKGEIDGEAEFKARALDWIFNNPLNCFTLYIKKFINFWRLYSAPVSFGEVKIGKEEIVFAFSWLALLSVWLASSFKNRRDSTHLVFTLSIILFALSYSVFFTRVRFRMPIEPLMIILASGLFKSKKKACDQRN